MGRKPDQSRRVQARAARSDAKFWKDHAKSQSGASAQKMRDHAAKLIHQARDLERGK